MMSNGVWYRLLEGANTAADDCELDKVVQHKATECEHLIRM